MTCRICLEEGDLISPCNCTGTAAFVHAECLVRWLNTSGRTDCEICKYEYIFEERYEKRCVVCPKVSLYGRYTGSIFLLFIMSVPSGTFLFRAGPAYAFFASNFVLWLVVVLFKYEVNLKEKAVLWKLGSCLGQFIVAFYSNFWFYLEVDTVVFLCLFMLVYLQLVCNQSKQVVQYIYTGENT